MNGVSVAIIGTSREKVTRRSQKVVLILYEPWVGMITSNALRDTLGVYLWCSYAAVNSSDLPIAEPADPPLSLTVDSKSLYIY